MRDIPSYLKNVSVNFFFKKEKLTFESFLYLKVIL